LVQIWLDLLAIRGINTLLIGSDLVGFAGYTWHQYLADWFRSGWICWLVMAR